MYIYIYVYRIPMPCIATSARARSLRAAKAHRRTVESVRRSGGCSHARRVENAEAPKRYIYIYMYVISYVYIIWYKFCSSRRSFAGEEHQARLTESMAMRSEVYIYIHFEIDICYIYIYIFAVARADLSHAETIYKHLHHILLNIVLII